MPINVNQQIQDAMARGDFDNLPGKGKPMKLESNPLIPPEVRMMNQMLKDNGLAPRWITLEKEIQDDREKVERSLANIKGRRKRLAARIRVQPLRYLAIRRAFERERERALETYTEQLKTINGKIQRFNLVVPCQNKGQQSYNLNAAIARFHEECPSL